MRTGTQIDPRKKFGRAAYIVGSDSKRWGIAMRKHNGANRETVAEKN
jgi:hypothetical protein